MSRLFSPLSWRLEHRYISITPAMSQRGDRYPLYAKAALCQACHNGLRLTRTLESKGIELLSAIPEPFLSLHLRFEPDTVAYSQCQYSRLSPSSQEAIEAVRGDRKPWTGDAARVWRKSWTNCLHSQLARYPNTQPYINGLMDPSFRPNAYTKAALDYYVSINSDAYIATYFGNMDKMVSMMRALKVFL